MTKGLALFALMTVLAPVAGAQTNPPAPAPTPAPASGTPSAPGQSGGLVVDVEGGISAPMGIAIPALPTPEVASTAAGPTDQLGKQLSDVITADLKNSGLFKPLPSRASIITGLLSAGISSSLASSFIDTQVCFSLSKLMLKSSDALSENRAITTLSLL